MEVLIINELNNNKSLTKLSKVIKFLNKDDFYSAEVKKLKPSGYYRAKLDYANRVLFKIVKNQGKAYAAILEIIDNHSYEKSRFLNNNVKIQLDEIKEVAVSANDSQLQEDADEVLINKDKKYFNYLDKLIFFDEKQDEIYHYHLPIIAIGSAGSGKTSLTLEKLKTLAGDILYVSHSAYLVKNAQDLYHSNNYYNEEQNIEFLTFAEFLESIRVPEKKELDVDAFLKFIKKYQQQNKLLSDGRKVFEEFKGVITGMSVEAPYLTKDEYFALGVKQSIYTDNERIVIYDLFVKYLEFLQKNNFYDSNIISHEYTKLVEAKYDVIVIDEIQDFTNLQVSLILKTLHDETQFFLCGDSNQIVHPNFFSWAKLRSQFYTSKSESTKNITKILTKNYRNSDQITNFANLILKIKNNRFGSIDKESNYLMEQSGNNTGNIAFLETSDKNLQEINNKISRSVDYAVIVLHESHKINARKYFKTPLIFSVQEAKGLEYKNVILYDFICSEDKYKIIAQGVDKEQLQKDIIYSRVKDKTDKSLEVYKFYINALYVAITRTVQNIYILEPSKKHPLLNLLGLDNFSLTIDIAANVSSQEDWQQEANKLAMQGKLEQSEEISKNILHQKKVAWQVVDKNLFNKYCKEILSFEKSDAASKAEKLLFLEYAIFTDNTYLVDKLAEQNFKPAKNSLKKLKEIVQDKYCRDYAYKNINNIKKEITKYGIDYKNQFNYTPLAIAASFHNEVLVSELLRLGANKSLINNEGFTPYQIMLRKYFVDVNTNKNKTAVLHKMLQESDISLKVDEKLVKISSEKIEYLLINLIISKFGMWPYGVKIKGKEVCCFTAQEIEKIIADLPEAIFSKARKSRSYISGVLARNEINRDYKYNRKIFKRIRIGYYCLNPDMMIKNNNEWRLIEFIKIAEIE